MRVSIHLCFVILLTAGVVARAQNSSAPRLITSGIDENQLVTLRGNTHPLAKPAFDKGAAPADLPMSRMLLVLKRSAQQEAALAKLLVDQQTPGSPDYHRWLMPQEFGQRFGLNDQDLEAVTGWLQLHGFTVDKVSNGRTVIEFSGNASQVELAFHTPIHQFVVNGESHWANAQDPQLPLALTPAVAGVASLNNFISKPQSHIAGQMIQARVEGGAIIPLTNLSNGSHALAPADYATIYNINPVFSGGITGSGVVIGVVGRTNINIQDVISFRSVFGLPNNPPNIIVNGPDPGDLGGGEEIEAVLDTSWAGATAPGATVDLVVSKTTNTTDGVTLSEEYIIDNNLANVMTESFGSCEADYTSTEAAAISSLAQEAAADGITYMVSSGDSGSAGCDNPNTETSATGPLSVNVLASTPYTVAVGGTQFNEAGGSYWNSSNNSVFASALSYIPEDVWNANCNGSTCTTGSILAGGGGASVFFSKPSWQTGVPGIPNDHARDVPDVSLTAALHDAYLLCIDGSCTPNSQNQIAFEGVGGTSAAAPSFAGIVALVNQKMGSRQGLANPVLYALAATEALSNCNASNTSTLPASTCIFNDVTVGTNAVPGEANYNTPSETYLATAGYDLASGLGSVNVANLVNNWSTGVNGGNSSSVNPSSGTGSTQTFTVSFTAPSQAQEHILFNTSLSAADACYVYYYVSTNTLNLLNDQANSSQSATPGSSSTLSNSQCSVAMSGVTVSQAGNTFTMTLPITFSSVFVGSKNIYTDTVSTSNQPLKWLQVGTWTVPAAGAGSFAISVSPGSQEIVAGNAANYMVTLSPLNGFTGSVSLSVSGLPSGAAETFTPNPIAISGPAASSSSLLISTTAAVVPGNYNFTIAGQSGSVQQSGSATLVVLANNSFSVNPSVGSGSTETFTFSFTASNQSQEHILFNTSLSAPSSCYVYYYMNSNTLHLLNDQANGSQSAAPGTSATLSNSQCSVPVAGVKISQSGNTITIVLPITFGAGFSGVRNIYADIVNTSNQPASWQQTGTWTPMP